MKVKHDSDENSHSGENVKKETSRAVNDVSSESIDILEKSPKLFKAMTHELIQKETEKKNPMNYKM